MINALIEQTDQKVKDKVLLKLLKQIYQTEIIVDNLGFEHYARLVMSFDEFIEAIFYKEK